jgi:GDP-L-fucose synthase
MGSKHMPIDSAASIYVAGHHGLIGSAIVRGLRDAGFVKLPMRSRAELELTDTTAVERFFEEVRPEYVVLAAGRVGGIVANRDFPADFITENLAIQLNVMRAAWRSGVRRLLFFGSSCMYPKQARQPMAEELLLSGALEETSMAYAVAKLAGTETCLAFNRQHGGERFVPVIPNSVYGPNDDFNPGSGHVLSALITRFHAAKENRREVVTLWGTGAPRREFLHADDLARACVMLLGADLSRTRLPLNIGPGEDVSIAELAELVAKIVRFEGTIEWDRTKPDGAPRKLLDSARVRGLGWRPAVSLEAGIRATYDWYVEHQLEKAVT